MTKEFYSNGKLLLSGEYAILDGALSLALPTLFGQHLHVSIANSSNLFWKSLDDQGNIWFEANIDLSKGFENLVAEDFSSLPQEKSGIAVRLLVILKAAQKLNPNFLSDGKGFIVETTLGFPRDWGLGSSSTLINNIAQWAQIDAFQLLWNSFSGSGYDIACAQHNQALLYRLEDKCPKVEPVDFDPPYKHELYFIHLNKKKDSLEGIAEYRKMYFEKSLLIEKISEITRNMTNSTDLKSFEKLVIEHEELMSEVLKVKTVKKRLFADFTGAIKSLGAWGGDFILATGGQETPVYFRMKGYRTILPYSEIILQKKPPK